ALLIDLDRIQRGIAAGITARAHRTRKRGAKFLAAVEQDVRESQQQRQAKAHLPGARDRIIQRDPGTIIAARTHHRAAGVVDVDVTVAPMGNGISRTGNIDVPGVRHRGSPDNEEWNVAAAGLDATGSPTGSHRRRGIDCDHCNAQVRTGRYNRAFSNRIPACRPTGSPKSTRLPVRPSATAWKKNWPTNRRRSSTSRSTAPPTGAT